MFRQLLFYFIFRCLLRTVLCVCCLFGVTSFIFLISAATTVEKGGIDSLTLHVGMLGVAGIVTTLFPFYSGSVGNVIINFIHSYFCIY